jgi:hypothetical protein
MSDLGEVGSDLAVARPDDAAAHADAVRLGDRGRPVECNAKRPDLLGEVGVERQLLRHDERRDENDVRAAVGREPAGEVERVLGLGAAEKRHDDAAIAEPPHRMTW